VPPVLVGASEAQKSRSTMGFQPTVGAQNSMGDRYGRRRHAEFEAHAMDRTEHTVSLNWPAGLKVSQHGGLPLRIHSRAEGEDAIDAVGRQFHTSCMISIM
jgi:hypothetical protein